MATDTGGGDGADPAMCASAAEYALQRMDEREKPVTAAGLAAEYDCTQAHMRHSLADLVEEGQAERVSRGKYVAVEEAAEDGEDDQQEPQEVSGEPQGENTSEATEDTVSEHERPAETDGGPEISEEDRVDVPAQWAEDVEAEQTVDVDGDQEEPAEQGAGGIPVEAAVLAAVALFVLVLVLRDSSSEEPEEDDDQADENGAAGLVDEATELVEG